MPEIFPPALNKFTLFLFSVCIAFSARAQEELSLRTAIETGLANNYDIRITGKEADIAALQNSQGQAGRWPSLSLSLSQPNSASEAVKTASPFQPRGIIISSSLNAGADLNWTIFEGFRVNITKERLDKLQLESEGNAAIVVSNTIQAIVLSYYLATLEAEKREVLETSLKLSRERYYFTKLRHGLGSAMLSDLLLEEGNYLTDSANLFNQELSQRSSIRVLNQLMAVQDLDKTYRLTDTLAASLENYTMGDLEAKMLSNNTDLRTRYISQSIIHHDLRLARSERYPKLLLSASASNNWGRVDQSQAEFFNISTGGFVPGPTEIFSSESRTYAIGFSLTYNLFNNRRISTAIRSAILREENAVIETYRRLKSLGKDLLTEFDNYNIRKRQYEINARKREVADQNVRITGEKFRLGAINSFDFRTIQLNYLTAAIQELNSRYGLLESKVNMMRITGTIIEEYK